MSILDDKLSRLEEKLASLEGDSEELTTDTSAREKEARRTGRDRSVISLTVVALYFVALIGILIFLASRFPTIHCEGVEECEKAVLIWKDMASVLLNVVSVAILPVVTLVLGFYFGSEKAKTSDIGD